MKRSEDGPSIGIFTIGIAALFMVGFLLLVILGANAYRNSVGNQNGNNETRSILSYLAAVVKANDAEDAISFPETEEGTVLVIRDGSGYALRIYCRDGVLLEDYGAQDAPLAPEGAQIIGHTSVFEVKEPISGMLEVVTDEGRSILTLRSQEGIQP